MNTIPSTFNQQQVERTVLGGAEPIRKVQMPVTCIVLNRMSRLYRSRCFSALLGCGFERIVSVEQRSPSYNTEQLSLEFPEVKFVVLPEGVTVGDMINIGMAETDSRYVLMLYDDLCGGAFSFTAALAAKLAALEQFCVCPRLVTSDQQNLPVRFTPGVNHSSFNVESSLAIADKALTLYPADLAGFYDREKFIRLGGFDCTIKAPYWQKLDLFFRSWLWGERISLASSFVLSYAGDSPQEDRTADISYLRFYLKNLLPVFRNDHGEIPFGHFFSFKARSSCGLNEAFRLFREARRWTNLNKYRFKTDAVLLTENWGATGDEK
ncbi:MAG TPA: hypothetical protein DDW78_07235 [Treponema sp.]|nr:hypothetical protein [Treponema sp.]